MAGNSVIFKANANGLVVVFDKNEPFESIFSQISGRLESGGFFFKTRYLSAAYKGRRLTSEEESRISRMMADKTGARTVIFEIDKDFEKELQNEESVRLSKASGDNEYYSFGRTEGSYADTDNSFTNDDTDIVGAEHDFTRVEGNFADIMSGGSSGNSENLYNNALSGVYVDSISGVGFADGLYTGGVISGSQIINADSDAGAVAYAHPDDDIEWPLKPNLADSRPAAARTPGVARNLDSSDDDISKAAAETVKRRYFRADLDECVTKFYRGTLRSGRVISYDGNIVIVGDVNPGAEVEATGNIIVLGNVRGIVHAGASGNKEASITALNFAPTQLRIADIITNKGGRGFANNHMPEIAYIQGDAIIFEKLNINR